MSELRVGHKIVVNPSFKPREPKIVRAIAATRETAGVISWELNLWVALVGLAALGFTIFVEQAVMVDWIGRAVAGQ